MPQSNVFLYSDAKYNVLLDTPLKDRLFVIAAYYQSK